MRWPSVWRWWLIAVAVTFAVLETVAYIRGDRTNKLTLTAHVRRWIDADKRPWYFWTFGVALTIASAWLPIHFLTPYL